MKQLLVVLSLFFVSFELYSQTLSKIKHDYIWLMGYDSSNDPSTGWGGTRIDFNTFPPTIEYEYREMDMDIANTSMCNNDGELQFYSNGLAISNHAHEIMENGDTINPDPFTQSMLFGLIMNQGLLSLEAPGVSGEYYVIHEDRTYIGQPEHPTHTYDLFYTNIRMSANSGLGRVMSKNNSIVHDTLDLGKITACKHANGRDWWILVFELDSNKYYSILLTPDGFHVNESVSISSATISGIGQAFFFPDGTRYARLSSVGGARGFFGYLRF